LSVTDCRKIVLLVFSTWSRYCGIRLSLY